VKEHGLFTIVSPLMWCSTEYQIPKTENAYGRRVNLFL